MSVFVPIPDVSHPKREAGGCRSLRKCQNCGSVQEWIGNHYQDSIWRWMVCLEEMEQAQEAKDPVPEEVWEAAEEEVEGVVPVQAREEIVSARTVEKRSHIR